MTKPLLRSAVVGMEQASTALYDRRAASANSSFAPRVASQRQPTSYEGYKGSGETRRSDQPCCGRVPVAADELGVGS